MRKLVTLVFSAVAVACSGLAIADTLELANGEIHEGSFVHGRLVSANQSGRMAGSSELVAEFTDVMINDQLIPMSTGALAAQTSGEAGRTVGRTARAAAVGGLIGGSSGARTGARVGVGASILTRGSSINIPRGTILETTLAAPLTAPLTHMQ